jgi:hypothetical protein
VEGDAGPGGTTTPGLDAGVAVTFDAGPPLPMCDPGASDVQFKVDATQGVHVISRFVYGTNAQDWGGIGKYLTVGRTGGNRWTAYNWETNASNAGSDYIFNNDAYVGGGNTPGEAVRTRVEAAMAAGAAAIVTVPIQGYVAADKNGAVDKASNPATSGRFKVTLMNKGSAPAYPPNTGDANVYQDEFVSFIEGKFPRGDAQKTILYSLDNEPDLWASTHAEIQKTPLTYDVLVKKNIEAATMIKRVAPQAPVLGFVSYGWSGYVSLQNAPDANKRDFIDFYLDQMKAAEQAAGKRLVDVLDLHYYTEAKGDNFRVSNTQPTPTAGAIAVRLQSTRSLWDPTYVEPSWITDGNGKQAIRLIPRMKEKIAAHYPGTLLALTEYDFGQGDHISGALAEADALGIFGREDLFLATHWPLVLAKQAFTYAGIAMFRDYDGNGGAFGDTSIAATTSSPEKTSIYASLDASGSVVLVAINKTDAAMNTAFKIAVGTKLTHAAAWQLTSAAPKPTAVASPPTPDCQAFLYSLPPMSVTTLVLH